MLKRCLLFLSLPLIVEAKSLGTVGEVFPVAEINPINLISNTVFDKKPNINNYPSSLNLPAAIKTRVHFYKPEFILQEDIKNATGQVILKQGIKVNALDALPDYKPCWIFADFSQTAQRKWVNRIKKTCLEPKIILTGGSLHKIKEPSFFDQEGRISKQLGISYVPAIVTRKNNYLLIKEVALKENGDEL
ncbi:MAG: hypothetical protein A3F18_00945 [Legionellales bacterium RIFCSPHIGHO2_12_FULL_37_14]|nr:MAG: hypothetical protein A3F18_00945 [Legionellales bacterium RIFCSPHIGHO2_12_FULL_37_14]